MDRIELTAADLLAALTEATDQRPSGDDALTTTEMQELWGLSHRRVLKLLRPAVSEGRVEVVRKPIVDLAGRRTTVFAYRPRT